MRKLIDGIQRFQQDVIPTEKQLFEELANGQHPVALVITCSDSRIDPNLVTQTKPGEIFVLRTAGNIVPPYDALHSGEAATIEYAVKVLQVPDIIICGHSHCGAVGGLLAPSSIKTLPAVQAVLKFADKTAQVMREEFGDVTEPEERLAVGVQQNVLNQIENLRTHPAVAEAVAAKTLEIHGWVYTFETGVVTTYDPASKRFVDVAEGAKPAF
ncbi:MAG: carbonic anhydrase [Phycisphaerae bacterium]|nr:MAG: carbonic anhydrase [Phycisphaerae bacterium]